MPALNFNLIFNPENTDGVKYVIGADNQYF